MDIKNTITLVDNFTPTLNRVNKSLHTTLNVMKRLDKNMTMGKFNTQAIKSAQAVNKLETSLNKASTSAKKTKSAFDSVKSSLAANFAIGNIATQAIWALLSGLKSAIVGGMNYASGMVEVQNVVNNSYGSMTNEANKWAKTALKTYGLNELSALKYIGTLNSQIQASGLAGKEAGNMAMKLTGLAGDLASFYNIPIEQAFNKIRSGLSGTVMPLRQLGIDMTVATLSAHALTMGITAKWKTLSQAQKTLIRYNYLMKVTGKQQGDFERTFYTFANQQRYSEMLWLQLTGSMMNTFLPALDLLLIAWNKMIEAFMFAGQVIKKIAPFLLYLGFIYVGTLIPAMYATITALATQIGEWIMLKVVALQAGEGMLAAWVMANAPMIAIMAGIGAIIGIAISMGATFESVLGTVTGAFYALGAVISGIFKIATAAVLTFIGVSISPLIAMLSLALLYIDRIFKTDYSSGMKKMAAGLKGLYQGGAKDLTINTVKKYELGYGKGAKVGAGLDKKTSSFMKSITAPPAGKLQDIGAGGLTGTNGSPKGTKGDPVHTKIDKDDITLLVEVAKQQITNRYTRLQPILQAKFGDVHQTADVYDVMDALTGMISDAHNNSLGTR